MDADFIAGTACPFSCRSIVLVRFHFALAFVPLCGTGSLCLSIFVFTHSANAACIQNVVYFPLKLH